MARRCQITEKANLTGHKVSHSNIKTLRSFKVNVQNVSLRSDILGRDFNMRIATTTLRSIDHNGGLDGYLLNTSASKLSPEAAKLRRKIKKTLEKAGKAAKKEKATKKKPTSAKKSKKKAKKAA